MARVRATVSFEYESDVVDTHPDGLTIEKCLLEDNPETVAYLLGVSEEGYRVDVRTVEAPAPMPPTTGQKWRME